MAKVTKTQMNKALALVADWLGSQYGLDGPAPTGNEAAANGLGPVLDPTWDWPNSGPTPTILLEGGPEEWAYDAADQLSAQMAKFGISAQPYASYALCLYREE